MKSNKKRDRDNQKGQLGGIGELIFAYRGKLLFCFALFVGLFALDTFVILFKNYYPYKCRMMIIVFKK